MKPRQVKDVIEPQFVVEGAGVRLRRSIATRRLDYLDPLNEPIARYGPFVMNTKEEIAQALEDLRNGTFVR